MRSRSNKIPRHIMKAKLLIVILLVVASITAGKIFFDNRGFTPWMTMKQMDQYLKPLEVKDANGKGFWDHRWITDIRSRWHDGYSQYRLRIGDAPDGPHWWYWYFNLDRESLVKRLEDMRNQNFQLVSFSSYTWPDGTERFCAVWHRIGKQ